MKIVFPELNNPIIKTAVDELAIDAVPATDLADACEKIKLGTADALIAGIDYSSRDVILACRDGIGAADKTFSSCMVFDRADKNRLIVADIATCKNPTADQLYDIIVQTYATAIKILNATPRVAVLSFSTLGSGGKDESIARAREVIGRIRSDHPEILIDGELQLDAAINPAVAAKKAPNSQVTGKANVLICPDLNSGNILYKAIEQFGGYSAAGPILQGFNAPASDLSRGSTVEDVKRTIEIVSLLA